MIGIEMHGNNGLVNLDEVAFTFETTNNPRELQTKRSDIDNLDWINREYTVENFRVFPYGYNNDLPSVIREVVQNNSIAPGILKKKAQLIWGKGPKLYKEIFTAEGVLQRQWVEDATIMNWLESWGFEDYLIKANVDYCNIEGVFTKFYLSKGSRIYKNAIGKLEHVSPEEARLAVEGSAEYVNVKPSHCIITDWSFKRTASLLDWKAYELFDFNNPFKSRNAILYSNMYSFCSDYYTVPDIYGSLEWIRRSTAIPMILKYLSNNSINLKYHITSPAYFWEQKKKELIDRCNETKKPYTEDVLVKYRNDFLRQISKVLTGAENTGKFWHSVKYMEIDGHKILEHGWEIKEIKNNIKDIVESQIKIGQEANRAVTNVSGVHSSITSSGEAGRADSGSEQLYALKNFLLTGIDIPEMIIMKAINYAIKANFPTKNLKLGFYHISPQREEDTSSKDRVKNQA